jgi:hypothetical protein
VDAAVWAGLTEVDDPPQAEIITSPVSTSIVARPAVIMLRRTNVRPA